MYLIYVNTDFILTAEQRASSNGEFWKTYVCAPWDKGVLK